MKRIGITIGSERVPVEKKYYLKHKKAFDEVMSELSDVIEDLEDLTYDVQIYALLKKYAPKNIDIVPLWKTEYTKKDLDECDLVFCLYEFTYALRDDGEEGFKKYLRLMKSTKSEVSPSSEFQRFVLSKQTYMNYFKRNGIPIMDTLFYNLPRYSKDKKDAKVLLDKINKKFTGAIYCKPELGGFAEGSKLFKKLTLTGLKSYLNQLLKSGYKKLLIQPYIDEFLKFYEIKTIWLHGKFQYAYGQKVKAEIEDVEQSKLDQKLLKELKKKGKEVMELLSKDFGTPFLLRIDWGCCLQNDSVCREYFLNEIECCPAMMGTDAEDHDCFERLAKGLIKKLK